MQAVMHKTFLATLLAACFSTAKELPQIAVSAESTQEAPLKHTLTVQKFVFVSLSQHNGPVTWDVQSHDNAVMTLTIPPQSPVVGIHEGQDTIAIHRSPSTSGNNDVLLVAGLRSGTAVIAAWGVQNDRAVKIATIEITVQGPRPPPRPVPPPPPTPTGKINHWVLVEETRQASANRGVILTDVIKWSKDNKIPWAILDKDAVDPTTNKPPEQMAGYIRDAVKSGLPRLYICNAEGETLWEGTPPNSSADFLKLLEQFR